MGAKTGSEFVGTMDNISHPIHASVLNILGNQKEWPSGSAGFLLETTRIRGWIKGFGLQSGHQLKNS